MIQRKTSPLCKFTSISLKSYMKQNDCGLNNQQTAVKQVDTPNLQFSKMKGKQNCSKNSHRQLFYQEMPEDQKLKKYELARLKLRLQESKDLCVQTNNLVDQQSLRVRHFYQQKVQELNHVFMAIETEIYIFREQLMEGLKFGLQQSLKSADSVTSYIRRTHDTLDRYSNDVLQNEEEIVELLSGQQFSKMISGYHSKLKEHGGKLKALLKRPVQFPEVYFEGNVQSGITRLLNQSCRIRKVRLDWPVYGERERPQSE